MLDELRSLHRRERVLDEFEKAKEEYLEEDLREALQGETVVKSELGYSLPGRSTYDMVAGFLRTKRGFLATLFLVFLCGFLYYSLLDTEVVLREDYRRELETLERVDEYTRYLEKLGVKVVMPRELAEKRERMDRAVRLMDEFNERGLSPQGIGDINPGLENRRRILIWRDRYQRWLDTPRTMQEMLYYSLPVVGILLLVSIPFLAIQVVRGARVFTVVNHLNETREVYLLDEGGKAGIARFYDPSFRLWRFPVAHPLTLEQTGEVDVYFDDAFVVEPRKGARRAGIYAKKLQGGGGVRYVFEPLANEHGYHRELGYEREQKLLETVRELREKLDALERSHGWTQIDLYEYQMKTRREHAMERDEDVRQALKWLKELREVTSGGAGKSDGGEARKKKRQPKEREDENQEGNNKDLT